MKFRQTEHPYLFFIICLLISASGCKKDDVPVPEPFQTPATENIVMYEVNTAAMSTTHNFQGVIGRIDSIHDLGINTIWLMPIFPVGIINSFGSPYCVRDYKAVNPNMGTMTDLQTLVNAAHERGMAVILDWVANHTSWDNAWINNPDWYTQDGSGNIISPPGTSWTDVADLNYDNADMRLAMIDAMEYWIENADIDGFRCDAADYVPFDFWQQAITALNASTDKQLILLAEGDRPDHFTAGFQMNFSWDFLTTLKNVYQLGSNAATLYTTNTLEYISVPDGDKKLRFITNHDESNIATPAYVYGSNDAALAATVIASCLQGVPLLYCGQEVGISSSSVYNGAGSINWTINPDLLKNYKNLFAVYNAHAALRYGILTTYSDANFAVFTKELNGEKILVVVNTRETEQLLSVPATLQGTYTNLISGAEQNLSTTITMEANGWLLLK